MVRCKTFMASKALSVDAAVWLLPIFVIGNSSVNSKSLWLLLTVINVWISFTCGELNWCWYRPDVVDGGYSFVSELDWCFRFLK